MSNEHAHVQPHMHGDPKQHPARQGQLLYPVPEQRSLCLNTVMPVGGVLRKTYKTRTSFTHSMGPEDTHRGVVTYEGDERIFPWAVDCHVCDRVVRCTQIAKVLLCCIPRQVPN
jgi:hypothetical protein